MYLPSSLDFPLLAMILRESIWRAASLSFLNFSQNYLLLKQGKRTIENSRMLLVYPRGLDAAGDEFATWKFTKTGSVFGWSKK